jgi:hypothetical protein
MTQYDPDFYASPNEKSTLEDVVRKGTFSASFGGKTYMGVRFTKDRAYLLKRMLKAEMFWKKTKEPVLSFQSIPLAKEPRNIVTLCESDWYVVDMDGRIYILSDVLVGQFEDLKPLSFDWHMYDVFPRILDMNREYAERYETETE